MNRLIKFRAWDKNIGRMADDANLAKIKATWPEYWKQYEEMGVDLENKKP